MNVVLSSIVGSIIGFIVASIVRPPYPFFKFTIIHIGIGNAVKLDFLLFDTLTWLPLYEEKELLKCSMICDWLNLIEIEENLKFCMCFIMFYLGLNHIMLICLTGNIGNVPLVLIGALCRDQNNPFGDSLKCSTDGTAYISFGQWVSF